MSRNTPRSMHTRLAAILLTLGLLVAVGCGGDTADDTGPDNDTVTGTYSLEDSKHTRNVEVFDNVKRLDDRAARTVHIDGDKLFFPESVADSLSIYRDGDIMATSTGKGLLRRVESIEERGDQMVVHTSPASLGDVFASGEIYVAAHAEPGLQAPESFRYEPQRLEGDLSVRQQPLEVEWDDSLFSYDKDFASDLNSRIPIDNLIVEQASVGAEVGAEFYANAGAQVWPPSFELKSLRTGANGTANATVRLRVESDESFSFERTYYLASTDSTDEPFKQLPAQEFDVAGLVNLKFGAKSKLELSASADGTVSATGEVQVNGNLRGGLERKNGVWKTYTAHGLSPSGYGPEFEGEKSFDAQAKLTTTLTLDAADAATGSLVVEPATITADFLQEINADNGQCPYLFNVNAKGSVSGQLESVSLLGFDIDIMDGPSSWTMYNKDFITKDGQLEFAGVCDPNYEPPSFGDGGRSAGMMCKDETDCDDGATCFRDTCVTEGPIRFSVAWFEDTDVDIQVTTPSGEVIDWREFANGALDGLVYDFPMCTTKCTGPGPYVESIYSEVSPQPGTYVIDIFHEEARAESDFALVIDHDGDVRHEGGKLPAEGESVSFEYTVN